jgi:hypothetical protein
MTLVEPGTPAGPPTPTLVVTHRPPGGGDGWDAYITGREPARVAGPAELNTLLGQLGVRATHLVGFARCDTPGCALAATAAVLTTAPHAYLFTRACAGHQPETAPLSGFSMPSPVTLRPIYRRRVATEIAEMTRLLLHLAVPAHLFAQPRCGHCAARIAPGPDLVPGITWQDEAALTTCPPAPDTTGDDPARAHIPGPGETAALIARYVADVRPAYDAATRMAS